jgi:predicted RNA methylase
MSLAQIQLRVLLALSVMLCCGTEGFAQPPNDAADVLRLADLFELQDGSVIAEIGAGTGALTIGIAMHVGSRGKVYSTEMPEAGARN